MAAVTDPSLLSRLNAAEGEGMPSGRVTDPDLLKQLNEPETQGQAVGAEPSWGEIAKDVAKQAASGVVTGLENIAATPAHIGNLIGKGYEYFFPPTQEQIAYRENLRKLIDQARGGGIAQYLPTPRTSYGESARNIADVATSAAGAGPLRGALYAGIGAEAARKATEGTTAEPYATMAGAVLGGVRGAKAAELGAAEQARRELLDVRMPEGITGPGSLYKQFDAAAQGTPVNWQLTSATKQAMKTALDQIPYDTEDAAKLVNKLNPKDVSDLAIWRQGMRESLYGKGQSASANALTGIVDRTIEQSLPAGHVGVGMLQTADREFSIMSLARTFDQKFHTIEEQTAATHSGTNLDNKIRQALVALQKNQRAWHGLTPQEQVQAQNIINGGIDANALRRISNALGGGGGMGRMVGIFVAHALFGPAGAGTVAVGAPMLKHAENVIAQRRAQNFMSSILGRSMFEPTVGPLRISPIGQRAVRGAYYGGLAPGDQAQ